MLEKQSRGIGSIVIDEVTHRLNAYTLAFQFRDIFAKH
jgi:hypothetical protein